MRIVDAETFMAMPAGTVFAKYEPVVFEDLRIKGDTLHASDFLYQDLIPSFVTTDSSIEYIDHLQAIEYGQVAPDLDYNCQGRDGCFQMDQLYAVFEPRDVSAMISRLQEALAACTAAPISI
jgi:hypothetical protein